VEVLPLPGPSPGAVLDHYDLGACRNGVLLLCRIIQPSGKKERGRILIINYSHSAGGRCQETGEKSHNIEQRTNEHPTLNAEHRTSNEK